MKNLHLNNNNCGGGVLLKMLEGLASLANKPGHQRTLDQHLKIDRQADDTATNATTSLSAVAL